MRVLVVLVAIGSLVGNTYQWTYNDESQWPGQCNSGHSQSPINIMTKDAVTDYHGVHIRGPLSFIGYEAVYLGAKNNGHTLKWRRAEESVVPMVSGGPLRGNYSFLQFHLHWLSEHAIDGMKYPLEIHMVHIKTGLTIEEALSVPDGLAVIGVMCQIRSERESEHALEEIMVDVPHVLQPETSLNNSIFNLRRLLSPAPQSFYTYHGSLTTPDCNEVVTWIVMDRPLPISHNQYREITRAYVGGNDNYRSLHPANRMVYRSVASCATILTTNALAVLASLLNCFSTSFGAAFAKGICTLYNAKKKFFGLPTLDCKRYIVSS